MKIATNLPNSIHGITYVKNSHWIELEDTNGTRHRMHDNSLVRYECGSSCGFFMLAPSHVGNFTCPACKAGPMRHQWQRMQVCFVPERETDFYMPQADEDESEEVTQPGGAAVQAPGK